MPDDQAKEKQSILNCLGAIVHIVPNASISNAGHYVNVARRIALDINQGSYGSNGRGDDDDRTTTKPRIQAAFMNQFENESNYQAHVETTGPELWNQTNRQIDVFCMSSGTGATLSGVGRYLKDQSIKEIAEPETQIGQNGCRRWQRPCQIIFCEMTEFDVLKWLNDGLDVDVVVVSSNNYKRESCEVPSPPPPLLVVMTSTE